MLTKCFLGNTAGGKLQYKRHFQIFGACLTPIYPSKIETTHPFCFCLLLFSPTFALIWALRIDVLAFIYILQNWYLTQRRDQRMSVDKFSQMFQGSKYHLWHNVFGPQNQEMQPMLVYFWWTWADTSQYTFLLTTLFFTNIVGLCLTRLENSCLTTFIMTKERRGPPCTSKV